MDLMKKYLPIGACLAVISIVVIPGSHWVLSQAVGFDLLGLLKNLPIVSRPYIFVFLLSILTGFLYLLVSVRSLRRKFGPAEGAVLILVLFVTCPFGGFVAFWMRDSPVSLL